jgi:hypothetical protein
MTGIGYDFLIMGGITMDLPATALGLLLIRAGSALATIPMLMTLLTCGMDNEASKTAVTTWGVGLISDRFPPLDLFTV